MAKDKSDPKHRQYADLYRFYLDIVPHAYELYHKWKAHPGFRGTRLRTIERENGEIVDVPGQKEGLADKCSVGR